MLLLAEIDLIQIKEGCKWILVWSNSFYNVKVIFTFFAKVIVLRVESIAIDVWGLGFKFISKRSTF